MISGLGLHTSCNMLNGRGVNICPCRRVCRLKRSCPFKGPTALRSKTCVGACGGPRVA